MEQSDATLVSQKRKYQIIYLTTLEDRKSLQNGKKSLAVQRNGLILKASAVFLGVDTRTLFSGLLGQCDVRF